MKIKTCCRYVLILLLAVSFPVSAEMYKWVDDQGRVHFSDKPGSKAQVERLKPQTNRPAAASQQRYEEEYKKLSNMPPGQFQQMLEEIQEKHEQSELRTRHQVELQQEQRAEEAKERAEKNRAEAKKREAYLEEIRPKYDKNGRIKNMKQIRKHYGLK